MRDLSMSESADVGGGSWGHFAAAIFIYDAVTDFAKGFAEGFEEAGGYNQEDNQGG